MLKHVQHGDPALRHEWVDSCRGPGLSFRTCHRAAPRRERPVECASRLDDSPDTIRFAKHLEKQNREAPRVFGPSLSREPEILRSTSRSEPSNVEYGRIHHAPPRLPWPRLGDVNATEVPKLERRIRTVYRIDVPLRTGRVIDVLV